MLAVLFSEERVRVRRSGFAASGKEFALRLGGMIVYSVYTACVIFGNWKMDSIASEGISSLEQSNGGFHEYDSTIA